MEPTSNDLARVQNEFIIWDIQKTLKEYREYVTECHECNEECLSFEDYVAQQNAFTEEEYAVTSSWSFR